MMKALTEFLAAGLKTEQPKATLQGGDSGPQPFAKTMEELLALTTSGSHKLASMTEQTDSPPPSSMASLTADSASVTEAGNFAEQPRHLIEAETMDQLMGDFTMDIMKPGQDTPKTHQDTITSATDSPGLTSSPSGMGEEGSSPANFQETIIDLASLPTESPVTVTNELVNSQSAQTSQPTIDMSAGSLAEVTSSYIETSAHQMPDAASGPPSAELNRGNGADQGLQTLQSGFASTSSAHSGLPNTATSVSVPTDITLNMVEAAQKLAGRSPATPTNTVTVTATAAATPLTNTASVATPEAVGIENSLARTAGGAPAELFDVAARQPLSQTPDRPSVDPRPETAADRAAVASSAAVVKTELTARQPVSFDAGIKLSNTEPQQFAGEMATHVRVLKNQSGGEVKLNLHPAELGRMSISVSTEGNETRVAFVVETSQARQAVETALPRLRDMLENAGLSLSDSDVSEQRDNQADADERGPGSSHGEATSPDTEDVSVTTVLSVTVDPDRLVDTYI